MRGERYPALDGLRGVAAIAVVLMHGRVAALHGYLAVDLFFILSGFVIACSYECQLESGEMSLGRYVRTRIERLYPMLLLGSLLGIVLYGFGWSNFHPRNNADLALASVSQVFLVPCLSSASVLFVFNNPQWSILWELAANAAHAMALPRLTNRVLATIAGVAGLTLGWIALQVPSLSVGWSKEQWLLGLPRVAFGFFAGVLLYRTRERWMGRVPQVSFAIPALIFLVLVNAPPQWLAPGRAFALYDLALVSLCFVPLVMLAVRAKAGPFARGLGMLSYPLYAINEPIIAHLDAAGYSDSAKWLAIAALILAAWLIGKWVDEPLNAWRRRTRRPAAMRQALPAAA